MQNTTQQQGSHMYVLTLQTREMDVCTVSGTCTPPPGATRYDVLVQLQIDAARRYPSMTGGIVLHFALESNTV